MAAWNSKYYEKRNEALKANKMKAVIYISVAKGQGKLEDKCVSTVKEGGEFGVQGNLF